MTPDDFPIHNEGNYGFFGFEGAVVDRAINDDRADWLRECIDRGFINEESETLGFLTIRGLCKQMGAARCERLLGDLGWPLTRQ